MATSSRVFVGAARARCLGLLGVLWGLGNRALARGYARKSWGPCVLCGASLFLGCLVFQEICGASLGLSEGTVADEALSFREETGLEGVFPGSCEGAAV